MGVSSYFDTLEQKMNEALRIAETARAKHLDPVSYVEITPTKDIAARVQAIVGPPGVAEEIRASSAPDRETLAIEIVRKILEGKFGKTSDIQKIIEQAIRTGVAILTEGVLVAPTEGISRVAIKKNPDGSTYLAIYFAGPIRSAGGTIAAYSVLLADYARTFFGISGYRPTDSEIERYVEEITLYRIKVNLQYTPSDDDIRYIVSHCPVCIDGDPTEEFEVSVHRNLERVETNRVRGGIALVIAEGIAQKAAKVKKYSQKLGLSWEWIDRIIKVKVDSPEKSGGHLSPNYTYLEQLAAGRPIFSYPMAPGGFRLRYGRTRLTGIASKAIHPATMVILDEFPAIGTQLKIERPGKGCVVTPCETIDGPIVRLTDGSVVAIETVEQAYQLRSQVEKILFLGDMLVSYNDFAKANHPLVPGAWCEEYWWEELKARKTGIKREEYTALSAERAFKISEETGVPLHPRYTYFWHDITHEALQRLAQWLVKGTVRYEWFSLKEYVSIDDSEKELLEILGVPHRLVKEGDIRKLVIEKNDAYALLKTLGLLKDKTLSLDRFTEKFDAQKDLMHLLSTLAGIEIRKRAPTYIGARMGRPEKARDRELSPAPHLLFPLGDRTRGIERLLTHQKSITVQLAHRRCPQCREVTHLHQCPVCGAETHQEYVCETCGNTRADAGVCCNTPMNPYSVRSFNLQAEYEKAVKRVGYTPTEVKGVVGLVSVEKIPERLEKGILREKHKIFVSKDGTCRFDATDVPITHFYPREIGVSVEKLRELGYSTDYLGKPLERDDQLVPLKCQDVILSDAGADYFMRVAQFVDDELVYLYGMNAYYNVKTKEDLIGLLVIGLSPHTSAGVIGRIIGFTKANVGYAHPYFHCCKRRNCDGDEDSLILLLDAFLNFSMKFLPSSRGGTMDTPRVLITRIDPREVDDEVHVMETVASYDLSFYRATERYAFPHEVSLTQVRDLFGTEAQYESLGFTHHASSIHDAPVRTAYVLFQEMKEKVDAQFRLCAKIRAVNLKDAVERVILSHFLPDLYGNLRTFARQRIRCVKCNETYRRVPLIGRCKRCGEKLVLTISKGSIEKYLDISQYLASTYDLPLYLVQRLELLRRDINETFGQSQACKARTLDEFL